MGRAIRSQAWRHLCDPGRNFQRDIGEIAPAADADGKKAAQTDATCGKDAEKLTDSTCRGVITGNRWTEEGFYKAIGYFQQAIEKDPTYALAYTGIAESYVLLGWNSYLAPKDAFPKGKAAAMTALQFDPDLGEAHTPMAAVLLASQLLAMAVRLWQNSGAAFLN